MALENYTTNVDNIRQDSPEWVKEKISSELASLKKEVFYKKNFINLYFLKKNIL